MIKSKQILALLLAGVLLLSFFACGKDISSVQPPAAVQTKTVTDMVGRTVSVTPGTYSRVVCIGAGALRMYSYIGDVGLLAGVEDIDNLSLSNRPKMFDGVARPYLLANSDRFQALPSCGVGGPQAQTAEAEKILACQPDIVISEYEDADKSNALAQQLGVPVITLQTGYNGVFDDAFRNSLLLLGTVFDKTERAQSLLSFIDAEVAAIRSKTAAVQEADKPTVYICGLGNWGTTNHLMTAQNYPAFQVANVNNAVHGLAKDGIQPIEKEKFEAIGKDIDLMIIDAAAIKNIQPLYQEDPALFQSCKAFNTGHVYLQLPYNAYYTNFETALLNTWFIAKTAYPDLFADIDMTDKANEITEAFLGKALADAMFGAPQSFGGYPTVDLDTLFA